MASDIRQRVLVKLSDEQLQWLDGQIAAGFKTKASVIIAAINRAMTSTSENENTEPAKAVPAPQPAAKEIATVPPKPAPCSFDPAPLHVIAATLDILLKKYMIDHPGRKLSNEELVDLEARWDAICMLRTSEIE